MKFKTKVEVYVEVEAKDEAEAKRKIETCLSYFDSPGFEDGCEPECDVTHEYIYPMMMIEPKGNQ